MLRVLIDESLPRSVGRKLAALGHDVVDCRDIGHRGSPDEVIAATADEQGRIVVAADVGFGDALNHPPGSHPGMIVLRVPDTWPPAVRASRVAAGLAAIPEADVHGSIVVIEPARVRVLLQPIMNG